MAYPLDIKSESRTLARKKSSLGLHFGCRNSGPQTLENNKTK